jgi:hypothetical protein
MTEPSYEPIDQSGTVSLSSLAKTSRQSVQGGAGDDLNRAH